MLDKLTREDFLALFGLDSEAEECIAVADSQETFAMATFLVGRARYYC
ncbi:MAG TPA: hypothetical protein VJT14_13375 [Candidatus Dormibacteraeota bacterium]|nr:hypothetical protein [Candidatus Dormibacteraeota bacterium]